MSPPASVISLRLDIVGNRALAASSTMSRRFTKMSSVLLRKSRIRTILSDRGKDTLDFTRPARLEPMQHHIQGTRGTFQLLPLCLTVTEVRIQKDCHLGTARNRILDELHSLGCNFR